MCIIITKEHSAAPLPEEIFDIIWTNNPDGGGILYNNGKKTILKKGLMNKNDFIKAAKEVNKKGYSYIMHTRIATHGSIKAENTHPFVSKYLGFAHNGTFAVEPFPDKTDSETFFVGALGEKKFSWCENNKFLLDMATHGCRCAIMDLATGKIMHLCEADWQTDIKYKGYKFSNGSYKEITRYSFPTTKGGSWSSSDGYKGYAAGYGYYDDDLDDWDPEDKYGKYDNNDKKSVRIIDSVKNEIFQKEGVLLKINKDWALDFLNSYCIQTQDGNKKKEFREAIKHFEKEYERDLLYDGTNTYEVLSRGAIIDFLKYALMKRYCNLKEVKDALIELIKIIDTENVDEEELVKEMLSQTEEL